MQILALIGGHAPNHPYHETAPVLQSLLAKAGHKVTLTEDPTAFASIAVWEYDQILFHCHRRGEEDLNSVQRQALLDFVKAPGKSLTVLHLAAGSCPGWGDFPRLVGGVWVWGVSTHPPFGHFAVNIVDKEHPITKGLGDFEIDYELYHTLALRPEIHVLATATHDGKLAPMAWTNMYEGNRVFYCALGHAQVSFENLGFQQLVSRGVAWAGGQI